MYDKANVCRIANQLVKEGYTRSSAFVEAWAIEKGRVNQKTVQAPVQEVETAENIEMQVREYRELQAAIVELEERAKAIKETIITEMEAQQTEELKVDVFKVRYITVVSNRFNTTEFKGTHADLYKAYLKESTCKRFTIA